MDWSDDEPPYPSALTRPVPPMPGTAWGMVAAIAWTELRDGLRDLRQRLAWRLHTSREERAAGRYRRVLETPISPETRERAERFPLSGDIHMPWVSPDDGPLTRAARLKRFLLEPPPEDDSFI